MMLADHQPTAKLMDLWLECLLHDDITIRFVAFQVIFFLILKIFFSVNSTCFIIQARKFKKVQEKNREIK